MPQQPAARVQTPDHIKRGDYVALVATLGLDATQLNRLEFTVDEVRATVIRADPDTGRAMVGTDTNEPVLDVVVIPVV